MQLATSQLDTSLHTAEDEIIIAFSFDIKARRDSREDSAFPTSVFSVLLDTAIIYRSCSMSKSIFGRLVILIPVNYYIIANTGVVRAIYLLSIVEQLKPMTCAIRVEYDNQVSATYECKMNSYMLLPLGLRMLERIFSKDGGETLPRRIISRCLGIKSKNV